jgi:hypothetical protein
MAEATGAVGELLVGAAVEAAAAGGLSV